MWRMSSRTHLNVSIMYSKRYAVVGIIALNKKTPYNPKQLFWQRSDSAVIDGPESCVCCACSEFVEKRRERASERGEREKNRKTGKERAGGREIERERQRETWQRKSYGYTETADQNCESTARAEMWCFCSFVLVVVLICLFRRLHTIQQNILITDWTMQQSSLISHLEVLLEMISSGFSDPCEHHDCL